MKYLKRYNESNLESGSKIVEPIRLEIEDILVEFKGGGYDIRFVPHRTIYSKDNFQLQILPKDYPDIWRYGDGPMQRMCSRDVGPTLIDADILGDLKRVCNFIESELDFKYSHSYYFINHDYKNINSDIFASEGKLVTMIQMFFVGTNVLNESVSHTISNSDIRQILDIFNDLGDEGFEVINKDLLEPFYSPSIMEITYQLSNDLLDDKGKVEYHSIHKSTRGWSGFDNKEDIRKKYFNYYQQIIFNVNLESFSDSELVRIKDICVGIYDRLISCGYNCQLWEPGYKRLRFHISSQDSNPFIQSKNSLW